jgi:enoyl-CoA hydratase
VTDASTSREPYILEETKDRVAYLTFNRPDTINALTPDMMDALDASLEKAKEDDEVSVVVLKGSGSGFSSGFSIAAGRKQEAHAADDWRRMRRTMSRLLAIWDFPKPTVAQIHGYCMAGATQLATVFDISIAADNAVIGSPALPLGGGFISPMWVHLVGQKRAKEMSFIVGNRISGTTAQDWGWVNRAVPAADLDEEVRRTAEAIAATPRTLLEMKKAAINRIVGLQGFRDAVMLGADINTLLHETQEVQDVRKLIDDLGSPRKAIKQFRKDNHLDD